MQNHKASESSSNQKRAESEEQLIAAKALEEATSACLTMHNDTVRFKIQSTLF